MKETIIYLIRHCSTAHNENKIFQGHLESSSTHLTKKGISQTAEYLKLFKGVKFDLIYSSDLGRSIETAKIISENLNLSFSTSPLLRGKKLGRFEGLPVSTYREENKEALLKFKTMSEADQWDFKVEKDVESNAEVLNRTLSFINDIATKHPGKHILIVTHGGTIRNVLFHFKWAKQHELKAGSVNNVSFIKIAHGEGKLELKEVFGVTKGLEIS